MFLRYYHMVSQLFYSHIHVDPVKKVYGYEYDEVLEVPVLHSVDPTIMCMCPT